MLSACCHDEPATLLRSSCSTYYRLMTFMSTNRQHQSTESNIHIDDTHDMYLMIYHSAVNVTGSTCRCGTWMW